MSFVYKGNPGNFPTLITLPDDATPPVAASFNTPYEGLADSAAWLKARLVLNAISGSNPNVAAPNSRNWLCFSWDHFNERWTGVTVSAGNAGAFVHTLDGGISWQEVGTAGSNFNPIAQDQQGSLLIAFGTGSRLYNVGYGGGGIATTSGSGWNATAGTAYFNPQDGNSYFIGALQSGGTWTGAAATCFGSIPTNQSGNLPAAWVSGSGQVGQFYSAMGPSGTAIAAMGGGTPGTDTSRLLRAITTVMTDISPSFLSGNIVTGTAYDAVNGYWLVAIWNGTTSNVYASSDLSTWFVAWSLGGRQMLNLAAIGGVWVCAAIQTNMPTVGGFSQYSVYATSDIGVTTRRCDISVPLASPCPLNMGSFTINPAGSYVLANSQASSQLAAVTSKALVW